MLYYLILGVWVGNLDIFVNVIFLGFINIGIEFCNCVVNCIVVVLYIWVIILGYKFILIIGINK